MPGIRLLIEITNNGIRSIVGSDSDSDLVHHVVLVLPREVDGQGHVVTIPPVLITLDKLASSRRDTSLLNPKFKARNNCNKCATHIILHNHTQIRVKN